MTERFLHVRGALRLCLMLSTVCLLCPAVASATPAKGSTPADRIQQAFSQLVADPPPPKLANDAHFVISNELNHQVYRPSIQGLGGALVGVGSDQLYILASWAEPEVLVPFDFDSVIVDIHRIYGVLFKRHQSPGAFVDAWSKAQRAASVAEIDAKLGSSCQRCSTLFKRYHGLIYGRLRRIRRLYRRSKVPMFLTDDAMYTKVADLHRGGRVFPIRGNLIGVKTMKSLSAAAKAADVPIRVLYVSNAEQYTKYPKTFRDNILGLHTDDRSVLLRTTPKGRRGSNSDDYWYYIQSFDLFKRYMQSKGYRTVYQILRRKRLIPHTGARGFRNSLEP